jgi:1-acyl-sn-glycerol-3-phosphate acyltransferase
VSLASRVVGALLSNGARLISGVTSQWVGCSPTGGPRVYFANHSSHLDGVLLWSSLPRRQRLQTRPVAAKDYWERSFVRRYIANEVFRVVMVDRPKSTKAAKEAVEKAVTDMAVALDEGSSLIIFPEGTRGSGEEIGRFKGGIYALAQRRPDTEFVPVYLANLNRILPKGEILPVPLIGNVFFGEPLKLEDNEKKRDFLKRAKRGVKALKEAFS